MRRESRMSMCMGAISLEGDEVFVGGAAGVVVFEFVKSTVTFGSSSIYALLLIPLLNSAVGIWIEPTSSRSITMSLILYRNPALLPSYTPALRAFAATTAAFAAAAATAGGSVIVSGGDAPE